MRKEFLVSGKHGLFLLQLYLCTTAFAQNKPKTDTTTFKTYTGWFLYGCQDPIGVSNHNFKKDSVLYDFFQQVDKNKSYKYNDSSGLLNLLAVAESDSDKACFLPFLRMVDPDADEIYDKNCFVSQMCLPFGNYCIEPPIQFLVLFYMQHGVVDPLKLKQGVKFSSIRLINKKKPKNANLTQADYHKIYDLYRIWIANAKLPNRKVKNPLKHSAYKWVLEYKDYIRN